MTPLLAAILTLLTEAPQLVNGAAKLWQAFATFHNAGAITLSADQLAAMTAAGVKLDDDVAELQKAAGPKPTA